MGGPCQTAWCWQARKLTAGKESAKESEKSIKVSSEAAGTVCHVMGRVQQRVKDSTSQTISAIGVDIIAIIGAAMG